MKPVLQGSLRGFAWDIPDELNLCAQIFAGKAPGQLALLDYSAGTRRAVSFGLLHQMVDTCAAALLARGVAFGDRVGVLRGQDPWCAAAHLAIWKIGAVSVPLFKLFKRAALSTRIGDAGCDWVVCDAEGLNLVAGLAQGLLPEGLSAGHADCAATRAEDPAVLIYTSGTTGAPKGALHGHRILLGHLPGVEMSHDFLGQPGDCLWTPADWAWIGGLFDVLMPGLALGIPVVAGPGGAFDPARVADFVTGAGIRNVFFPPTALRMLKAADQQIGGLRSVASGGEPLGAEMLAWGRRALGVTINEFYGQTECNMVAASCGAAFEPQPGCIGHAVPGFRLGVIDDRGDETAGEGDIAVHRGAASMMLGYWHKPGATAEKFRGNWMLTGDRGRWEGAFLRFVGREDDVITSAGYRIGPAEIEDCLMTHPDVANCGVVGKPDPLRTEIVKAYVVRKPGADVTAPDLQSWVRTRLAAHSYPREVAFLESLPMTVTGKVIRKDLKRRAVQEGSDAPACDQSAVIPE